MSGRSGRPGPSAASRVQLALNTARGPAMVRSMKASSVKDHRAKTKTASTDSAQVRLRRCDRNASTYQWPSSHCFNYVLFPVIQ